MVFTQFSGDMVNPVHDPSNDSGDIISNHPQQWPLIGAVSFWRHNDSRWRSTSYCFCAQVCSFFWSFLGMTTLGLNWRLAPEVESPLSHHVIRLFSNWMNGSFVCKVTIPTCAASLPACRFGCQSFRPLLGKKFHWNRFWSENDVLLHGQLMYLAPCWVPHLQSSLFPTSIVSSYCVYSLKIQDFQCNNPTVVLVVNHCKSWDMGSARKCGASEFM